jgi:hypothetical protein
LLWGILFPRVSPSSRLCACERVLPAVLVLFLI